MQMRRAKTSQVGVAIARRCRRTTLRSVNAWRPRAIRSAAKESRPPQPPVRLVDLNASLFMFLIKIMSLMAVYGRAPVNTLICDELVILIGRMAGEEGGMCFLLLQRYPLPSPSNCRFEPLPAPLALIESINTVWFRSGTGPPLRSGGSVLTEGRRAVPPRPRLSWPPIASPDPLVGG